jgi:hypothetical protein
MSAAIIIPKRTVVRGNLETRLLARREFVEGHWLWSGAQNSAGYGVIREAGRGSRMLYVHRASYEIFIGPIPDGHQIDHECERTLCFKPECLCAVLPHVNNYYRNHGRVQTAAALEPVDETPYEPIDEMSYEHLF